VAADVIQESGMTRYQVTVEATGEGAPPSVDDLDALLQVVGAEATVLGGPEIGTPRYGAEITVDADSVFSAISRARKTFAKGVSKAGLPPWPVTRVSALTDAELDAELGRPSFPELVGIREIAELLGITPQRASTLCRSKSFPSPVAELRAGPVWTAPAVRRFVEGWQRQPGRPRLGRASA
jgi:hypothetical protein